MLRFMSADLTQYSRRQLIDDGHQSVVPVLQALQSFDKYVKMFGATIDTSNKQKMHPEFDLKNEGHVRGNSGIYEAAGISRIRLRL